LKALARSLGVEPHVHWPGFVQYPDLPAYYGLAEAFILASTIEPWGLVVNEAMASGLPVLVSQRCGCAPDLVREGQTGFTFDPEYPDSIAAALQLVSADPAAREAMGRLARAHIAGWSPERFGAGLLEASRMALARLGREDLGLPVLEAGR
jgi:glycosyltransferase involved in cell wall biosynthesis